LNFMWLKTFGFCFLYALKDCSACMWLRMQI